jgi:serine phosphatase RsbU (regulator of sigma subunit)/PAS domain-containing protein
MERELAELRSRRDALRHSAGLPGAQPLQVMSAAMTELDAAIAAAEKLRPALPAARLDGTETERRLLGQMFQQAPVALFLLDHEGAIRRANARAGRLIGTQARSAAGRLLTAFVDVPARATAAAQLATAARTGRQQHLRCRVLGPDGPFDAIFTIAPLTSDDQQLLLVAIGRDMRVSGAAGRGAGKSRRPAGLAAPAAAAGQQPAAAAEPAAALAGNGAAPLDTAEAVLDPETARVVEAMSQRLDLVTAATRLLLDNATFSEAQTLRRCARLLASELAAWVIVDVERRQRLRRQVVIGPGDRESAGLARRVSAVQPRRASLPRQVHQSGIAVHIPAATDLTVLGTSKDGVPLLWMLEATSVVCVPLSDGERNYGVLTLVRKAGEQPFEVADLGLIEELGQQLGLAIRVDRMFRRRSEIADSLQASLLPAELPELPGVELAAAYLAATDEDGIEVGGDFYDVYRSPEGWGIAIGDVCGKGEEAAAVTAAARHAIRVLAHWNSDPADVLSRANEVLQSEQPEARFITACAGYLQWGGDRLRVRVASAGHPGQLILRADGQVQALHGGGMALGLFPDAQMSSEEIELGAGDALYMFTDGVTEARSPEMAYFEEKLAAALGEQAGRSAAEIVAAMQSKVLEFSQNELRDDVTMLVLRVGGAAATTAAAGPERAGWPARRPRPGRPGRRTGGLGGSAARRSGRPWRR